ncbi:hypothetical protein T12_11101 [Trichinella patagoniensis]|uniref:Uncharacterized protein n=1 Tax=Trichinella patagoniensis TaxID=990121 RepID=A0A0V0ZS81_9BILA|nr:hypothetical protein T12_11101 [Trichinella patagoniensis]
MGVVNLSEIGLHLKQHSVAILSRNRTLTALPGTRTPNMLYDILSELLESVEEIPYNMFGMKNDNEYQNCVHYYQRCLFVNKIVVNIRSSEVSNLSQRCSQQASELQIVSNDAPYICEQGLKFFLPSRAHFSCLLLTGLRDCRWNASSTSRRSNLSLKSLILVELMGKLGVLKLFPMKKQENSCYGSVQLGG